MCLFLLCTYDAFCRQNNRLYRIAWWMSLCCGILIELTTILPREIGNFYHSQFTLMLFDRREPLYMLPCVYVWFLYTFTTVVWHCKWSSKLSEYAFTVVLIYFVWQPFDWIGIHFQFWTWHNDEPLYQQRRGGVPVASTFWMMSFIGGMQMTLRIIRDHYFLGQRTNWHRSPDGTTCILLALCGSLLNLAVFMLIPFGVLYHPISNRNFGLGLSCSFAMHCFLGLCGFVVVSHSLRNRNKLSFRPNERGFLYTFCVQIVCGYVMVCGAMMHWIDIRGLKQESYHQILEVHGRQERESSFWGWFRRNSFVVEEGINPRRDHYNLDCYDFETMFEGQNTVSWYALCATGLEPQWIAHFDFNLGIAVVLLFVIQFTSFSHTSMITTYARLSKMKQM